MWWYTTEYLDFSVFNLKQPWNGPQKWALIQHMVFQWNIQILWNARIKVAWGTLRCFHLRNTLQWDNQVFIFPQDLVLLSTEQRQWLIITACVLHIAEHAPQVPYTLNSNQAELWRHILSFTSFPMKRSVSQYLKAWKILLLSHVSVSWGSIAVSCIAGWELGHRDFKIKSIY